MIQSGNAPTHYKNRHSFALLQNLANEFNLRIIRTYGAAGHGKGTVDAMSSFGVKNGLRGDTVTQVVFFDTSKEIVEHLHIKTLQFYYYCIDPDFLALKRNNYTKEVVPIKLKGCTKQHLMVFEPNSANIMHSVIQGQFPPCLKEKKILSP